MQAGVSTACLYPQLVEEAVYDLVMGDITHMEIFFNSDSDMTKLRVESICDILDRYGADCPSVHPFACPIEPTVRKSFS